MLERLFLGSVFEEFFISLVFAEHDVDVSKPIVASCMTGMTACTAAYAAHSLGNEHAAVYYVCNSFY
jgi:3-mercaptopyruvate sulfurtransferase SseA